ncbi:MAG: peptidoglycan D,D-transpeptidase FtsI family protein [Dehalococcoidia bacterium]
MVENNGLRLWRLRAVGAVVAIALLVLLGRLAYIQIARHDDYLARAQQAHLARQDLVARRGAILDTNGYPLAMSIDTFDVYLYRPAWNDPEVAQDAAAALAPLLGRAQEELVAFREEEGPAEFPIARDVDYATSRRIAELRPAGIRLQRGSRRTYPEGNLAAPLIGFLGFEGKGLTGLERDLEAVLSGRPGQVVYEQDGLGNPIGLGQSQTVPPQLGSDVLLTIDRYIQGLAERELDAAIEEHQAQGGDVIVMDVQTGAVLAMASRPSFDLTRPNLSDPDQTNLFRNRAITDPYEPGSVFKLITVAAALNESLVIAESTYEDSGVFQIRPCRVGDKCYIRNWDFSANGTQTVTQLLRKSLNTGAAWLSQLLGRQRFYDYVHRFGFGQLTGIHLDGEAAGQVRTPNDQGWSSADIATNSFGQGISVTPLQMVAAVAAIANDGVLMQPYIVKEWTGPDGRRLSQPQAVRQVITPQTARAMARIMNTAVENITAVQIPGYQVAGKTGTASIVRGNDYLPDRFVASFAGFVPLSRPRIAILVKIDEPQDVPWGSAVAAPTFGRLAERILDYLRVPPEAPLLVRETR